MLSDNPNHVPVRGEKVRLLKHIEAFGRIIVEKGCIGEVQSRYQSGWIKMPEFGPKPKHYDVSFEGNGCFILHEDYLEYENNC